MPPPRRRDRAFRPSLAALEERAVPALLASGSAVLTDGYTSAAVDYTVTSDAPGHEGRYLWRYDVTNFNIGYNDLEAYLANDTGMGFGLAVPAPAPAEDVTWEYLEPASLSSSWRPGAWGGDHMTGQFIPWGETARFSFTTEPTRIVDAIADLDQRVAVVKGPGVRASTGTDLDVSVQWPEESFTPTGVTLTATVTTASDSGPLTGVVEFTDGGAMIGSAAPVEVSPGVWVATLATGLPYGSHEYVAEYVGDEFHKKSVSVDTHVTRETATEPEYVTSSTLTTESSDTSEEAQPAAGAAPPAQRVPSGVVDPLDLDWDKHYVTKPGNLPAAVTVAEFKLRGIPQVERVDINKAGSPVVATAKARYIQKPVIEVIVITDLSWVTQAGRTDWLLAHERIHLQLAMHVAEVATARMPDFLETAKVSVTPDAAKHGQNARAEAEREARTLATNAALNKLGKTAGDYRTKWNNTSQGLQDFYDRETVKGTGAKQGLWNTDWKDYADRFIGKK